MGILMKNVRDNGTAAAGRENLQCEAADPRPRTGATGREYLQPKAADPGPPTAAGRPGKNHQSKSPIVVAVCLLVLLSSPNGKAGSAGNEKYAEKWKS